jgi:hypothetical protein
LLQNFRLTPTGPVPPNLRGAASARNASEEFAHLLGVIRCLSVTKVSVARLAKSNPARPACRRDLDIGSRAMERDHSRSVNLLALLSRLKSV